MKTINDFKLVNGVAILEGVAYAEEAKVVDDYLKANNQIKSVSVISKDGRNFELRNGKLVLSNGQNFSNPYYTKYINEIKDNVTITENEYLTVNQSRSEMTNNGFNQKLLYLEERFNKLENIIKEISILLESYSKVNK